MQILINTDHNIEGREGLATHVRTVVEHALAHVHNHVTSVTVHLSDENSSKGGADDKRCVMEARLNHHQPLAVTHHAASLHEAIEGAASKLSRLLDKVTGRLHDERVGSDVASIAQEPTVPER